MIGRHFRVRCNLWAHWISSDEEFASWGNSQYFRASSSDSEYTGQYSVFHSQYTDWLVSFITQVNDSSHNTQTALFQVFQIHMAYWLISFNRYFSLHFSKQILHIHARNPFMEITLGGSYPGPFSPRVQVSLSKTLDFKSSELKIPCWLYPRCVNRMCEWWRNTIYRSGVCMCL